jgi:hypothetical protein
MAAVIFAMANLVQSGVVQITSGLSANQDVGTMVTVLIVGFIDLAIGLVAAVVSVWIAIKVLDRIATGIEEMEELAKGNVAVATVMGWRSGRGIVRHRLGGLRHLQCPEPKHPGPLKRFERPKPFFFFTAAAFMAARAHRELNMPGQ